MDDVAFQSLSAADCWYATKWCMRMQDASDRKRLGRHPRAVTAPSKLQRCCHLYILTDNRGLRGAPVMTGERHRKWATTSLDSDDYAALGGLAQRMDISASWLTRPATRDFLDTYRDQSQPQLVLPLAGKHKS